MVWHLQHSRGFISALLQRRQQIKWFSVYSTAEVLYQPCCRGDSRSNGSVSIVQWRFYLSLVVEKTADQMVQCLQRSGGLTSALLQRRQRVKCFCVYSITGVVSQPWGRNYEPGLKLQAGLNLKAIDNGPEWEICRKEVNEAGRCACPMGTPCLKLVQALMHVMTPLISAQSL